MLSPLLSKVSIQLWRALGTITTFQMKQQVVVAAFGTQVTLLASYFHQHLKYPSLWFYQQFKCLSIHHFILFFGLGSISWSGHQVHISVPIASMLEAGITPEYIPVPQQLLFSSPLIYGTPITNQAYISIHHLAIGLVSIVTGILASRIKIAAYSSWHYQLSVNLAILGSISIFFAHHISAMPTVYPMLSSDYPSLVSLFSHHINIGALFIIGSAAHTSIFIIRDYSFQVQQASYQVQQAAQYILSQRDVLTGHLIFASIFLGFHSFGTYIHNDTILALDRPADIFSDTSIQLNPVFIQLIQGIFQVRASAAVQASAVQDQQAS